MAPKLAFDSTHVELQTFTSELRFS